MIKLRCTILRRSIHLGVGLILLCIAGGYYFREEPWVFLFEVLGWCVVVMSIVSNIVVSLLRKAGLLEFTYTEVDRCSYLYNQEKLHKQVSENRRARKRE
jgi:hypothetical protein